MRDTADEIAFLTTQKKTGHDVPSSKKKTQFEERMTSLEGQKSDAGDYGGFYSSYQQALKAKDKHIEELTNMLFNILGPTCRSSKGEDVLKWAKISPNGFPPQKMYSPETISLGLRSAYNYSVPPRSHASVATDIAIKVPPNTYGRISGRTILARQFSIDVANTIIDSDY